VIDAGSFSVLDGGLRMRVDEAEWRRLVRQSSRSLLPEWALPLPSEEGNGPDDGPAEPVVEAIALLGSSPLEVQVASAFGTSALLGMLSTDLSAGAAIARRVGSTAAGASLFPGIELSVMPLGRVVDEVMRLVPPEPDDVTAVLEPMELPTAVALALCAALRRGDQEMIDAICSDFDLAGPPAVIRSLTEALRGNLTITMRSSAIPGPGAATWLLGSSGWVQVAVTAAGTIAHTPCRRADVERVIVAELARHVAALAACTERAAS
jgi:hypothetical protein